MTAPTDAPRTDMALCRVELSDVAPGFAAREHELLHDNLAIRDMGVIAYAGVPLIDAGGHALGTLCVIDSQPRHWTTQQIAPLKDLADPLRRSTPRRATRANRSRGGGDRR